MSEVNKIQGRCLWLKGLFTAVLFMAAVVFGTGIVTLPASEVQAAEKEKGDNPTVPFTDKAENSL